MTRLIVNKKELHLGGIDSITINAGHDATNDLVAIHCYKATQMLQSYYIGDIRDDDLGAEKVEEDLVDDQGRKLALNPGEKTPFKLNTRFSCLEIPFCWTCRPRNTFWVHQPANTFSYRPRSRTRW